MSAYSNDPRVVINEDGSARIREGVPGGGDWRVWHANVQGRLGWVVVNDGGRGHLRDGVGNTRQFGTVDDGIAAVIGGPQVTA
jgi:hypothetical protein